MDRYRLKRLTTHPFMEVIQIGTVVPLPPQKLANRTHEPTRPHPDAYAAHHLRLENLLDSTLATVSIILDPNLTLSDHAEQAFRALCRRIGLSNRSAPASEEVAPAVNPSHKSDSPALGSEPAPARHSVVDADLIFRIDELSPPPPVYPPPAECFTALQKTFADSPDYLLAGVRWTRNGNLSVNFDHDATWTPGKALASSIWSTVQPLLCFPNPCPLPKVDLGGVWHSVIVHNIPELPTKPSLGTWLRMGGLEGTFAEATPMRTVYTKLSIRISFHSETQADHIVTHGALIYGSRCRASHCKPRTTSARSTAA
ncbi:hypothetical protein R3P38DRAFT_3206756 [Favolaschia claudopus]|uniref:Uncharacterized protein n=1 Tax=Favolaschia claudopus TaxID=2862362 RepID=A0AAW0AKT9_9AGAR